MSHGPKAPSLRMIADRLGVSTSLVSKVLNNRMGGSGATPTTAAAIRSTARELGYRKNHAAAALVSGRQNVIGGFLHAVGVEGSGITEQLVLGLVDAAARNHKRLMLRFFQSSDEFIRYLPEISPTLLDGLVLGGIWHADLLEHFREIEESGVPIVTVHENHLEIPLHNVAVDQAGLLQRATEHLLECGCRRIAHISVSHKRLEGYLAALSRRQIPVDRNLIYKAGGFTLPFGEQAVAHLESTGVQYDGIVAQSDHQAIGALHALLRRGRRVPEDVKVVGVDNSPLCTSSVVPLSSISSEFYRQGNVAVDMLVRRIAGEEVESQVIEPVLVTRASTLAGGEPTWAAGTSVIGVPAAPADVAPASIV